MADGSVLLEVVVEGKNVKVVQRDVERVTDAVNENTSAQAKNTRAANQNAQAARNAGDAHGHFDRGLKGAAGTAGAGAKNFSKMRDVIGGSSSGLVGAYATLAANLFAATAAFGALQKAAQVEQLTQGLAALGNASGLAMGSLSKGLQEATGYAISLQDSMRQVAMVTSAGFDPAVIERLGIVAKNTSVALGRDLQDSMNRLVKGATKLEPELLDELGIMVRIDEATEMYAKEMGKTASQLTNFEKRQAFMNAVLAEGEQKFGAIGASVDANPYDKLSAKLQELATTVLNAFNVILAPIANFLAENTLALGGLIAMLSGGLIKTALPVLSMMAAETAKFAGKLSGVAEASEKAAKKDVAAKKSQLATLKSSFGAFGKQYNLNIQNARSLQDWQKIEKDLVASIENRQRALLRASTKDKEAAQARINQLNEEKAKIQEIIKVEQQRKAGTFAGGPGIPAGVARAQGRLALRSADILSSLDATPTFENYRKQMTKSLAAGARFRANMRGNEAAAAGFAGRLPLIGEGLGRASIAFQSFGLAAKVAIKGIFTAIPVIGQLLFVVDLLIVGLEYVFNLFKSDATKKYEEQVSKLTETFTELKDNSKEVNKGFTGVSASITTQTQAVTAQFNIVSSASAEFNKTLATAADAGDYGDLISSTEDFINSNDALKKSFQERIKVELKGKDIGTLSDQQRAKFLQEFLKEQNKAITSQNAYNAAIKETGDQLTKYFNTLTTSTPLDSLIDSFINLGKAEKSLAEDSAKAGNQFTKTKAIIDNFGQQGLAVLGLATLATQFSETAKKAESFSGIIEGFPKLKEDIGFWAGAFGGNDEVLSQANAKIEEINKNLKPKDQIPLLEKKYGSGAMKEQLDAVAAKVKKLSEQDNEFAKALEQQLKISEIIDKRVKQAIYNYGQIFAIMQNTAKAQAELNTETAKQSQYVLLSNSQLEYRINKQKELNSLQVQSNNLQIMELEQSLGAARQTEAISGATQENTMNMVKIQGAINNLTSQNAKLTADTAIAERDRSINLAKNTLKNIEEEVRLQQEVVSLLQKQAGLYSSITDASESLMMLELRIADLRAGGTGEIDVSSQLRVLKEFEAEKQANIDREYQLKSRTIALEEKITRAKLAVTAAELQVLIKSEESKANKPGIVVSAPAPAPAPAAAQQSGAGNILQSVLSAVTSNEYFRAIAGTTEAGVSAGIAAGAAQAAGEVQSISVLSTEEIQALKDVLAEIQKSSGGDIAGAVAALEQALAAREKDRQKAEVEVSILEKQRQNVERTYSIAVDVSNQILDAAQTIDDIYSRINSARTSILDNQRRVTENELKAINLRENGKYELTAQQTLDLEIDYANKRSALIKEEETRKLNMIDLEFALLKAQMIFQKYEISSRLDALRKEAEGRKQDAILEKAKPENKDPQVQAQLDNIITSANSAIAELNSTATSGIEKGLSDAIAKIPELAALAKDQIRSETAVAISDLDASKLIKDRNIIVTATLQTILPEAGQIFDTKKYGESIGMAARGAIQDQVGAVSEQMKQVEAERSKLLDSDVIDMSQFSAMSDKLKELRAQRDAIAAGEDPFANMKAGISAASVALAPFIESLKGLGPQGELVASIASGTLVMADSMTKFAESGKTAADKMALVGSIVSSVASVINAASSAKISGIDAEINAEKQRDGKSKESLAKIAAMEKKKESAKRKAFETNKKMMMATTIINTAAAAMAAFAPPPTGLGPLLGPALGAMIIGLGAAQLAIISGMSYEGGGGSVSATAPTTVSVGQRKSTIDLAKSQSASGELGYLQGDKGMGGAENFRPAFIGSRAAGGRVNAGYMVGEQGPELFVPKLPGRIVPADKVNAAPAQNVNISISALDAAGVEEVLTRQRGNIIGMIREAANSYGEKFLETVDTSVYTQPSKGYGVARA
jgi:hypothetical protein